MPADLADLTPTAASLLLRDVLPGRRVASCVQRIGGQLSRVYEASFGDDTDPLIIKIYAEAWRWKQAKESHVYQLLDQHRIDPVPRILHTAAAPGQLGGHRYTVMTLLPGQPLSAVSARLAESDLYSLYRQMGSSLAALHRIGQPSFGYLTTAILDPKPTNTDYMTSQFAKKLREFSGLGGDPALRAAIERHVEERAELFAACDHAVLCHNDFHEGNILVGHDDSRGWQMTGFIDVENAVAADPMIDLAKTDCYSIRGNRAKLDGLLNGYGPCGQAWAGRLAIYRLYHALELWDWFASIGQTQPLDSLAHDMGKLTKDLLTVKRFGRVTTIPIQGSRIDDSLSTIWGRSMFLDAQADFRCDPLGRHIHRVDDRDQPTGLQHIAGEVARGRRSLGAVALAPIAR